MKEVVSIEEVSDSAMKEDIKKLEDTMANEGIAPMVPKTSFASQRFERMQRDEELIAELESTGIDLAEDPAPSQPVNVMEEFIVDVEIEGMGTVKIPTTPIGRVCYTPPPAAKTRNRVFESGLTVIKTNTEKVPITVPSILVNVCNSLQKKVGNNEFSIVCKGHWDDDKYVISEEFKVPKQQVAGASVDYDLEHLEELKLAGFNTVIHSHPFKSANFSHSDDTTINSHFQCSVLYSVGDFTTATIVVVPAPGIKLVVTGNPKIEGEDNIVPVSESNNIETKYKYVNKYVNPYNQDNLWDEWGQPHNTLHGSHFNECEKEYDRYQQRMKSNLDHTKIQNDKFRNFEKRHYDYDPKEDVLYKDGKPIHKSNQSRILKPYVNDTITQLPIRVHGGDCGCKNTRIFRTEEPSVHANQKQGIFKTNESPKNMDAINRQKGGKKAR